MMGFTPKNVKTSACILEGLEQLDRRTRSAHAFTLRCDMNMQASTFDMPRIV